MSETFYFGLTTGEVKRLFSDVVISEGSVAEAITFLLNRDKKLVRKYRFRSLAMCEVWKVNMEPGRDTLTKLSPALFMLDTYVRFNRLDSRSAALEELLLGSTSNQTDETVEGIERSCQTQFRCSLLQKIPSCNRLTQTPALEPKSVGNAAVQVETEALDKNTQTEVALIPRCNEFVQIGGPLLGKIQEGTQGNARHFTISAKKCDTKSVKKRRNSTQAKPPTGVEVAGCMQMVPYFTSSQESHVTMSQVHARPQAGNVLFYRPPFPRGQFAAFPFTHPPVSTTNFPMPNYQGTVISRQPNVPTHIPSSNGNFAPPSNHGHAATDSVKIADLNGALKKQKIFAAPANDESYTIREKKLKLDSVLYPNSEGAVKCKSLTVDSINATVKQTDTMYTATAFLSNANSSKIENGGTFSNPVSRNSIADLEAYTKQISDVPLRCKRARKQTEFYRPAEPSTSYDFASF